jgi:hypothetical protein
MFKKIRMNKETLNKKLIAKKSFNQSLQSYYGVLKHCNGYKLKIKMSKIAFKK